MQKYLDYVQDNSGNALDGVSVTVKLAGSSTLATLYNDNGVTTITNPFTNESDGSFYFYAANGKYDITYTKTGYTFDADDTAGVLLHDPRPVSVVASVGNVGSGEDDLMSTTLQAGVLAQAGQCLRVTAMGTTAANGNNKTIKLVVGGAVVLTSGALAINNQNWWIEAVVWRTGASTQECVARYTNSTPTTAGPTRTALSLNEAATIVVKCTGEGTADNDIVQRGLLVEHF